MIILNSGPISHMVLDLLGFFCIILIISLFKSSCHNIEPLESFQPFD